jgi:16S rRNA (cytosine1407-C5)-methyltransferase
MNSVLPNAFIERLHNQFPEAAVQEMLAAFSHQRAPSIRTTPGVREIFLKPRTPSWIKNALILPEHTTRQLTDLPEFKQGLFYIQSLSSMIPGLVLDPKEDEVVLDMAAAPGSKTTQMAAMMNNKGKIIANDNSRQRTFKLKQNLDHQGVTNTGVISMDGQAIWKKYPEYFDKVLLDAPCSLEGTFCTLKPESYSYWSEKKIKQFSKLQKWLLRSAVSATKPGGTIVYSTCTISPEENEEVIDWILEKEKNTVELEEIQIKDLERYPAFTTYKNKTFHPNIRKTLRILPSTEMEGFFVAKLRKSRSNVTNV